MISVQSYTCTRADSMIPVQFNPACCLVQLYLCLCTYKKIIATVNGKTGPRHKSTALLEGTVASTILERALNQLTHAHPTMLCINLAAYPHEEPVGR